MRALKTWLREPLLHFVMLGALLYGAQSLHAYLTDPHRIVVTDATVKQIKQLYFAQFGESPPPDKLVSLIDRYIHEEALYREGVALGYAQNDELVRRRIVQKMEFLEEGDQDIGEPTQAQLKAFYQANAANYDQKARISFAHLYFSPDNGGEAAAHSRAEAALVSLKEHPDQPVTVAGDPFPGKQDIALVAAGDIDRIFGGDDFSAKALASPLNQWSGPFRSGYGWHLVKVEERDAAHAPALADIDQDLRDDWREAERARRKEQAITELMRGYQVVRKDGLSIASGS